jgi:acyl-CoA thioester hydrolase
MQSRPFETELHFQVKTYDVDYVGYAHNIVYIRWLEDLRTAMITPYYSIERCIQEGITPIITRTAIDYKKPLKLSDEFIGKVWLSKIEGLRWYVSHELIHQGVLAATAEQSGIFINLTKHRPVPIPEEFVKRFVEFQKPTDG